MPVDTAATLGDLVTEDPRRSRVLESHGLDYCCDGAQTLAAASTKAGLDMTTIAAALDLGDDTPAAHATKSGNNAELAHDIVDTHHSYMWEEMPRLAALVKKVHEVHGERHPELEAVHEAFDKAVAALEPHMTSEERQVFPTISKLEKGQQPRGAETLDATLDQLVAEHVFVGDLFKEIGRLTGGYRAPADGCNSYTMMLEGLAEMELDLHEHIHKENNILFPAARTLV